MYTRNVGVLYVDSDDRSLKPPVPHGRYPAVGWEDSHGCWVVFQSALHLIADGVRHRLRLECGQILVQYVSYHLNRYQMTIARMLQITTIIGMLQITVICMFQITIICIFDSDFFCSSNSSSVGGNLVGIDGRFQDS